METRRKVLLAGLGTVLFLSLLSANLVVAADRTVLDAGFVKESADESGLYAGLTEQFEEGMASQAPPDDEWPLERSASAVFREAVTEEYVRRQSKANVDRAYDYLHGERSEFRVAFETEPLKRNVVAELEAESEDVDLAALGVPRGRQLEGMAASESEFERHRAGFRERQKARIQAETDRELSDEELERRLEENMAEIRDRLHRETQAELDREFDDGPAAVEGPVRDLARARVNALTGAITYDEYVETVEAAKGDLGDAFVERVETRLDAEMPESIAPTEEMGESEREAVATARQVVSVLDVLALVLPVAALATGGLIAWVAPASLAALSTGGVATVVGAVGIAGSQVALEQIGGFLADAPPDLARFLTEVATGALATLLWQSAALFAAGVALLAAGVAIRRDLVPDEW